MGYAVTTPVFEGPLDLLLHLITEQRVDIHEISLSAIVEGFVAELERMERLELDAGSEFLMIASILVELKARRLLPVSEDLDLDDELALWEERDLLLVRLLECKTFKDAAAELARMSELALHRMPRRYGPDERFFGLAPDPLAGISPERVKRAFLKAVTPPEIPHVDLSHVGTVRLTVAETVTYLAAELPRLGRVSFRHLTASLGEAIEVIVHFLAVLELYKHGVVELEQSETFGELKVEWTGGVDGGSVVIDAGVDTYDG